MNIISSSYGNDSCALVQWAKENELQDVQVVFIDTGWSGEGWIERVRKMEKWVEALGFKPVHLTPLTQFESLIRNIKGFPNQRYQWCSAALKVVPFLDFMDKQDPDGKATILIGKRREESQARADTPEFIESSEYHGDRRVWHPLYKHTTDERNELLARGGVEPLPYRSQESAPCVNANRGDLRRLGEYEIERVRRLEAQVGKNMFRPKPHQGAEGILEIVKWANASHGRYNPDQEDMFCTSGYCGI